MNWSGVAQGEPIAMSEFAVMSNAEQLQEVHRAWAAVDQADPSATTNVAAAVLQVMDAFQLNDVLLRGAAALGLGGAAAQLGREVDAIRSFEQILAEPPSPETRELRTV